MESKASTLRQGILLTLSWRATTNAPGGECVIPPALPKAELYKLLFKHSEREAQEIKEYVEMEANGEEKVLHLEKVASAISDATMMSGTCTLTKNAGGLSLAQ